MTYVDNETPSPEPPKERNEGKLNPSTKRKRTEIEHTPPPTPGGRSSSIVPERKDAKRANPDLRNPNQISCSDDTVSKVVQRIFNEISERFMRDMEISMGRGLKLVENCDGATKGLLLVETSLPQRNCLELIHVMNELCNQFQLLKSVMVKNVEEIEATILYCLQENSRNKRRRKLSFGSMDKGTHGNEIDGLVDELLGRAKRGIDESKNLMEKTLKN